MAGSGAAWTWRAGAPAPGRAAGARLPAPSWGNAVARLLADTAMSEDNKIRLARGMGHLPPCERLEPSGYPRCAEHGRFPLTDSCADPTIVR